MKKDLKTVLMQLKSIFIQSLFPYICFMNLPWHINNIIWNYNIRAKPLECPALLGMEKYVPKLGYILTISGLPGAGGRDHH